MTHVIELYLYIYIYYILFYFILIIDENKMSVSFNVDYLWVGYLIIRVLMWRNEAPSRYSYGQACIWSGWVIQLHRSMISQRWQSTHCLHNYTRQSQPSLPSGALYNMLSSEKLNLNMRN